MPLGPTIAIRAPFATEKLIPEKTSKWPKDFEREETVIRDTGNSECGPMAHLRLFFYSFGQGQAAPGRKIIL